MKNYKDIAEEDIKAARGLLTYNLYNQAGIHVQQACEKQLKFWLEEHNKLDIALSRTHNLRRLLREVGGYENTLLKDAAVVENYYFDTRYPGRDYMEITEEDVEAALTFYDNLTEFLNKKRGV
jgi:HEPN domain-containing protein